MEKIIDTKNGLFIISDTDQSQSIELELIGVWEDHILSLITKENLENTIAIDAGANIGTITIPLAKAVGQNGLVYSFEMSETAFNRLNQNILLNNLSNVKTFNLALSDRCNEEVYYDDIDFNVYGNHGDIRIKKENGNAKNLTSTIDSLEINSKVSFIKIDCQGYDLKVLKGAKNTIIKNLPIITFEWESDMAKLHNDTFDDVIKFFNQINYTIVKIKKDDWLALPKAK